MRKLYVKLAAVNICNNRQLYLPYLLAGVRITRGWSR